MSIFSKTNRANMIKFGPFYYPLGFYELADHHVLGPALKKHYEVKRTLENYDYLMAVRGIGIRQVNEVCQTFVAANGPRSVNVIGTARQKVVADVAELFDFNGRHVGFNPSRLRKIFEPVTTEVLKTTQADDIGASRTNGFWQSRMFLAVHGWRMKRIWRRWMPNSKIPVDRLTDEAFAKAMEESSNTATLEQLGMTEADLAEFLDFSGVPATT